MSPLNNPHSTPINDTKSFSALLNTLAHEVCMTQQVCNRCPMGSACPFEK